MNNSSVRIAGLVVAVFPFACAAIGGGRMDTSAGGADATVVGADASSVSADAVTGIVAKCTGGSAGACNVTATGGAVDLARGGATGTTTAVPVPSDSPPSSTVEYGVIKPSSHPCTASTTALYDAPPLSEPTAGCKDIYDSAQSYPAGATRTIVAPTAPNGASCVAIDCWCSENKAWQPAASNLCR